MLWGRLLICLKTAGWQPAPRINVHAKVDKVQAGRGKCCGHISNAVAVNARFPMPDFTIWQFFLMLSRLSHLLHPTVENTNQQFSQVIIVVQFAI
jgi:hypothetical protein